MKKNCYVFQLVSTAQSSRAENQSDVDDVHSESENPSIETMLQSTNVESTAQQSSRIEDQNDFDDDHSESAESMSQKTIGDLRML